MYERMYHILFNAITDAMEKIEWQDYQGALTLLEMASLEAEEIYITEGPIPEEPTESSPVSIYCPRWCLQEGETL